jgi:hypothetical protein
MSSTLVVSVNAAVEKQNISILRASISIIMQPFVFDARKALWLVRFEIIRWVGTGKPTRTIQELKFPSIRYESNGRVTHLKGRMLLVCEG